MTTIPRFVLAGAFLLIAPLTVAQAQNGPTYHYRIAKPGVRAQLTPPSSEQPSVEQPSGEQPPVQEPAPARLEVSSTLIDFGTVLLGQETSQTLIVYNSGGSPLILNGIGTSGLGFYPNMNCGTIAPDGSCSIAIRFTAPQAGPQSAFFSLDSNVGGITVSATATVQGPSGHIEPAVFPASPAGTTAQTTALFVNDGPFPITYNTPAGLPRTTKIVSQDCPNPVDVGVSCYFTVQAVIPSGYAELSYNFNTSAGVLPIVLVFNSQLKP